MRLTNENKNNSKVYRGVSLIFEHFKDRERKLVHALYNFMTVKDVAKLLGTTEKFVYKNFGSLSEFEQEKKAKEAKKISKN